MSSSLLRNYHTSPLRHTTTASDLDSDSSTSCESLTIVRKSFLEPICDDCVVREHKELMAHYTEDTLNHEGLVWGSEVQIEICTTDTSKRTSTYEPCPRHSTGSNYYYHQHTNSDRQSTFAAPRQLADTPFSAGGDADDERSLHAPSPMAQVVPGPLTDVRGRPRSRTKQLRRRGIDLSRDDLRISSRWSDGEKRSMEDFREGIREKAKHHDEGSEALFTKWTSRGRQDRPLVQDVKSIKDKLTETFRNRVSRGGHRSSNRNSVQDGQPVRSQVDTQPSVQTMTDCTMETRRQQEQDLTLQQVQSSTSGAHPSSTSSGISSKRGYAMPPTTTGTTTQVPSIDVHDRVTSWQRHLQHDLQPPLERPLRSKKGKYLLQDELQAKEDTEAYWRLPSLAQPHLPYIYSERTPVYAPIQPQRLNEITSSADFESAWWRNNSSHTSRNISNSSGPVTAIDSGSTSYDDYQPTSTELIARLKARLANTSEQHEANAATPLLQLSMASTRLVSSVSLPDTSDFEIASRYSSLQCGYDNGNQRVTGEMNKLALHPLTTKLPHENLVRPSVGGWRPMRDQY